MAEITNAASFQSLSLKQDHVYHLESDHQAYARILSFVVDPLTELEEAM